MEHAWEQAIVEKDGYWEEIAYTKQLEQAKSTALNYISNRIRTEKETVEYLQKKGFEEELVAEVIAFLHQYQYLDDETYCRAWIHDRVQFHPCGRKKMAAELSKKVSDRQLVQMSLEAYFSEEQELDLAMAAAEQKLRTSSGKKKAGREQLARFLYSRGYGSSIIGQVLYTIPLPHNTDEDAEAFYFDEI